MLYLQELETDNWLKGLDKVVPLGLCVCRGGGDGVLICEK